MERVEDVMQYPSDVCYESQSEGIDETESYAKLKGNIELKNVTFGYSKLAEPLISNFSMTVKSGQRIALP